MTQNRFDIREDDLSGEQTRDLLAFHLQSMRVNSPPDAMFALGVSGLRVPEITVWGAWSNHCLAGIGALKMLDDRTAEVKSMRTHPDFLRKGVAAKILDHLIAKAIERGARRLSLETGTGPAFEPALALYRQRGFVDGAPFADYVGGGFNQFLHLDL